MNWGKVGVAIGIGALWASFGDTDAVQVLLVTMFVYAGIEGVSLVGRVMRYSIAIPYFFYSAKEDWRAWRLRRKQEKCGHPGAEVKFVYKLNAAGEVRENLQCRLCGVYPYPWWPNAKMIYPDMLTGEPRGWG